MLKRMHSLIFFYKYLHNICGNHGWTSNLLLIHSVKENRDIKLNGMKLFMGQIGTYLFIDKN